MGTEIIGGDYPKLLTPQEIRSLKIYSSNTGSPVNHILSLLQGQPCALMLLLTYTLCALIRSAILDAGINFHAVAWLFGSQGVGKSTAAKRTAGFVVAGSAANSNSPALFFDCASKMTAVREALTKYRDLPIILDDVCFSASKVSQEKRTELAGQLIREASNSSCILERRQGEQVRLGCKAGVILTSEFAFGDESDVTRCIMMKIPRRLTLPPEYNSGLSGAVSIAFLKRFILKADTYLEQLKSEVTNPCTNLSTCQDIRLRTNLPALRWCFGILLEVAADEGMSLIDCTKYQQLFDTALEESLQISSNYLATLRANKPKGNLAHLLLEGFNSGKFHLVLSKKKIDTQLSSSDGVYLPNGKHSDFLCLRSTPLLTFVRQQAGYRNYTLKKITDDLISYGALSTNERGTYQVQISESAGVPRVYRISLSALKYHAKTYETADYVISNN